MTYDICDHKVSELCTLSGITNTTQSYRAEYISVVMWKGTSS